MTKVAIVTGGASGIGLAVCTALSKRRDPEWHVHLLDMNAEQGSKVRSSIENITFHHVDITNYTLLSTTVDQIFKSEGRLDFVHSNAGLVERLDFYAEHNHTEGPPPKLDHSVTELNLKGTYDMSYLAVNYFRRNKEKIDASLVLTASTVGLYPLEPFPMYSGSKHAILGFMRSASTRLIKEGIRINAVCPGAVRTNILGPGGMDVFPKHHFTPVGEIVKAVLMLLDGKGTTDAKGVEIKDGDLNGLTVEVNVDRFYFRSRPEYCDDVMKAVIEGETDDFRHQLEVQNNASPKEEGSPRK